MLLKSILYTYRNKVHYISMCILNILMVVAAIVIASETVHEPQELSFEIEKYSEPVIFYHKSANLMDSSFINLVLNEYITKSSYKNIVVEYYLIPTETTTNDFIINLMKEDRSRVEDYFIAGATFKNNSIIAWLNNEPLHTAPLTINLVHNALLRYVIKN